MFNYPAVPPTPGSPNGIPVESAEAPLVNVDPKAVEAAKALRAKEAVADEKEAAAEKAVADPAAAKEAPPAAAAKASLV